MKHLAARIPFRTTIYKTPSRFATLCTHPRALGAAQGSRVRVPLRAQLVAKPAFRTTRAIQISQRDICRTYSKANMLRRKEKGLCRTVNAARRRKEAVENGTPAREQHLDKSGNDVSELGPRLSPQSTSFSPPLISSLSASRWTPSGCARNSPRSLRMRCSTSSTASSTFAQSLPP